MFGSDLSRAESKYLNDVQKDKIPGHDLIGEPMEEVEEEEKTASEPFYLLDIDRLESQKQMQEEQPFSQDGLNYYSGEKGNGGHVFVCNTADEPLKIVPLEYWYDFYFDIDFELSHSKLSYENKIRYAAKRLQKYNPLLAKVILDELNHFDQVARFIPHRKLPRVLSKVETGNFKRHSFQSKKYFDCSIHQFAVNFNIGNKGVHYLFSKELWNIADSNTKAIMVLHEIISRYFNSMLGNVHREFFDPYNRYEFLTAIEQYVRYIVSDALNKSSYFMHLNYLYSAGYQLAKLSSFGLENATVVGPYAQWPGFKTLDCGGSGTLQKGSQYLKRHEDFRDRNFYPVEEATCLKQGVMTSKSYYNGVMYGNLMLK